MTLITKKLFARAMLKYNDHIKAIAPAERLLVFHPKQGWEPLCKHVGKPVPSKSFPKTNEGRTTYELFLMLI